MRFVTLGRTTFGNSKKQSYNNIGFLQSTLFVIYVSFWKGRNEVTYKEREWGYLAKLGDKRTNLQLKISAQGDDRWHREQGDKNKQRREEATLL